jgi:hypothetical protein
MVDAIAIHFPPGRGTAFSLERVVVTMPDGIVCEQYPLLSSGASSICSKLTIYVKIMDGRFTGSIPVTLSITEFMGSETVGSLVQ